MKVELKVMMEYAEWLYPTFGIRVGPDIYSIQALGIKTPFAAQESRDLSIKFIICSG